MRPDFSIGDVVELKAGVLRGLERNGSCRIVSVLPETRGRIQYRVKFETESFERCVAEDDIVRVGSRQPQKLDNGRSANTSSWVNANALRVRK